MTLQPPSATDAISPNDLIVRLRGTLDAVLQPILDHSRPLALLDFPNHRNVGDSAIWLGTVSTLRRLGAAPPCYSSDRFTYSQRVLAQRLGRGTILLAGGGSLGDLWTPHQRFRERIIADFPDNPIVQLPQSITFRDPAALERARSALNRHRQLTLLVRDGESLALARREFTAPSILCPDMAFGLGALPRTVEPSDRVRWLLRDDVEAATPADWRIRRDLVHVNWLAEPIVLAQFSRLTRAPVLASSTLAGLRRPLFGAYNFMAARRLRRGCHELGGGAAIVTDRLHGHILCLLLGISHLVLDTRFGKLRGFYETWTHGCRLARWCDSVAEAACVVHAGSYDDQGDAREMARRST